MGRAARSLLGLAPGGVCRAVVVTDDAGGLLHHRFTLACALSGHRRSALCCTFRRVTPPGSYPAPCPVESGLSSARAAAVRRARMRDSTWSRAREHNGACGATLCSRARIQGPPRVCFRRPASQPVTPAMTIETMASQITLVVLAGLPPSLAMTSTTKARARPVTIPWKRWE